MRTSLRLSIIALVAIWLVGCGGGGTSGALPISSAPPSTTSPGQTNPNVDSSDTAGDWTSSRYDPSGSGDNTLQTSITEGNVGSLAPVWEFTGTVGAYSSVAVAAGIVYRTEQGGNTYAINEATGAQIWNFAPPTGEGFIPSPLVAGGLVYFPSDTGDFFVVGAQTGQEMFAYPAQSGWGPLITGPIQSGQYRGHYRGSPVMYGGTLFMGASNHQEPGECMQGAQVLALDPLTPTTLATATLTPNGTNGVGVWSSPVFDASGNMYVATGNSCSDTDAPYGDSILRMNPRTLSIDWHTPGPIDKNNWDFGATPVVVDGEVIDGAKDGYIYAFDTSSGQLLWKQSPFPNGNAMIFNGVATDGKYVAVPYGLSTDTTHGGIAVFDLQGNLKWSLVTGIDPNYEKGVLSPPAISQGMLFVGYTQPNCTSNCDGLGAFDLATGKRLWWYSTPTPVFGGIVVVSGGVFASEIGADAKLYCFLPSGLASQTSRRVVQTYGTHRAGFAYFHTPWLTHREYDGDNVGPLSP
jgi:outer membrane protein assembly factor BamB